MQCVQYTQRVQCEQCVQCVQYVQYVQCVQCVHVLLFRPLGHQLRLGPQETQGNVIKAVHGIPEIEGSIELKIL